jgi:hypothetical protein
MRTILAGIILASVALAGCSDDDGPVVDDEAAARLAYFGLDRSIDRVLDLGFDGFNAASSANIPTQQGNGDYAGTVTVGGQVDQGNSNNKGMRLDVAYAGYSDGQIAVDEDDEPIIIFYDGSADVDLSMKGLPDADLTGSFVGTLTMSGSLEGPVSLSLSFTGKTEENAAMEIQREVGTTHITGTATSDFGVFAVDVTR